MSNQKEKMEIASWLMLSFAIMFLLVLLTSFYFAQKNYSKKESICENKGLKYEHRVHTEPKEVCYKEINWNNKEGTYEKIYFPLEED